MSHLLTTRNPMSEARRQHVYGPIIPMDAYMRGEPGCCHPAELSIRWFVAAVALFAVPTVLLVYALIGG